MIRITKSPAPPAKLLEANVMAKRAELEQLFDSDPAKFMAGGRGVKLPIDAKIYGHAQVKDQLKAEQHDKCCFCEADFTANGYGDVEHFRPKGGYQQTPKGKIGKPGYYWLAYEWQNLFFSCQICNQQFKKNYFPLINPADRAISHHDNIGQERPQLIHLPEEDPEDHLGFREEVPFPKTERGEHCLKAYGLSREKLNEARRQYLHNVNLNRIVASMDAEELGLLGISLEEAVVLINKAKLFLSDAAKSQTPYAGMVRANFPALDK